MKQLITKLLMLAAMLSASTNLYAYQEYDFEVDGIAYNIISPTEKTVEVTYSGDYYYSGIYSGDIVIPEQVIYNNDTYSVTSIGKYAFCGCSRLTSVTIPKSVTTIVKYAFDDCDNIKAVHISDLAAWCKIDFESYTSNPLYYAHNLYLNGELVTDLTIPEDITEIKDYTFCGYSSLSSVAIPNSVISIGYFAFRECSGLTSVTIPNSVTTIGGNSFCYCYNLTSIKVPDSVTSIGDMAFTDCIKLSSVTIPNSVTTIGEYAFGGCIYNHRTTKTNQKYPSVNL